MMPTFPLPSLKFRTVGFPRSGFKASLSGATCRPATRRTENADTRPGRRRATRLSSPFACVHSQSADQALSPGQVGASACRCARGYASLPQGSLAPARVLLSRALIAYYDPIRQSRRHATISRPGRLYVAPSLCGCASATRGTFPLSRPSSPGVPSTIRRWVRDAVPLLVRTPMPGCLALSPSRHPRKPASASNIRRGVLFERGIVRFMLRPVWLPSPPDWLRPDDVTCAPPGLPRTLSLPLWTLPVTGPRWESG